MIGTHEQIRTRTPANPNYTAPEAAMPHTAWEALLQDAIQGFRPPTSPKPSAGGSRPPTPGHGPLAPHKPPPQTTTSTPGRERANGRPAAKGPEVAGRRPQGQGKHNTGARNHARTRKRKDQGTWHWGRGRNDGHQDAQIERARNTGRTSSAPVPHEATPRDSRRRTPTKTRRCSLDLTPHEPDWVAHTEHRTPNRGRRVPPYARRGYCHTGSRREQRTTNHHTLTARRRPRAQQGPPHRRNGTGTRGGRGHGRDTQDGGPQGGRGRGREETQHTRGDQDTPSHRTRTPRVARTPRGHGTKAQVPREGNPADTRLTHQGEWHTQTPATQTQRAAPHLTAPPGHPPAT